MKMCKKCILTTEIEELELDNEGVCNFCRTWERLEEKRLEEKKNLPKILTELKKGFVIGLSGGIDSSTSLDILVRRYGLKPKMAFSLDNGWNNPLADENVKKLIEKLKVPFEKIIIDLEKFKELQKAFLQSGVPNIEIPTDHILMAITYQMATKYGVKYIVSGGNHATEGIMPESWSYWSGDLKQIKYIAKKFGNMDLKGLPTCGLLKWNYYKWIKGIKIINLLDYYAYNQKHAKEVLEKKYNWQDYGGKHLESYFTAWFQNCYLPLKFGIDKRRAFYSSLINAGQMTREEAIRKLTEPVKFKPIILPEEFMKYPKKSHFDYPTDKWFGRISKIIKFFRNVKQKMAMQNIINFGRVRRYSK